MKKVYLAIPYSHKWASVRAHRFNVSCRIAKSLMLLGYTVFCPVMHNHWLAEKFGLPMEWDFWQHQDIPFLEWCDELWIIVMKGWLKSEGLAREILIARELGKQRVYLAPDCDITRHTYGSFDPRGMSGPLLI